MRLPRVFGASADHRPAWTTALVLALAGGAHALSLAWPFARGLEPGQPVAWLQLAAMTTLVWQLQRCQGARQAAWAAWLFATAMLAGTFWWLFISMHVYGGMPAPLAALAVLLLAAATFLFWWQWGTTLWPQVLLAAPAAQAAAVASLADAAEHLPPRMEMARTERARMDAGLRALGLNPLPSQANFLFMEVGVDRARALDAALTAQGVIVRPAGAFGAPGALRITVGTPDQTDRLLVAMAEALAEMS